MTPMAVSIAPQLVVVVAVRAKSPMMPVNKPPSTANAPLIMVKIAAASCNPLIFPLLCRVIVRKKTPVIHEGFD